MRWLVENEVNLVLHGHMHLPSLVKESRALDFSETGKVARNNGGGIRKLGRGDEP